MSLALAFVKVSQNRMKSTSVINWHFPNRAESDNLFRGKSFWQLTAWVVTFTDKSPIQEYYHPNFPSNFWCWHPFWSWKSPGRRNCIQNPWTSFRINEEKLCVCGHRTVISSHISDSDVILCSNIPGLSSFKYEVFR